MFSRSKTIAGTLLISLCLTACDKFEYNPYQDLEADLPHNLNQQNIDRLQQAGASADDTITIVFSGDSQRFYDNLEALVDRVNGIPDVDLFILAGDISDFGLIREFQWVNDRMSGLYMPYVCAIGNHDLTGSGRSIYRRMYGPENFSFRYKGYKFIFHDTNGREYDFNGKVPDLPWLNSQLQDKSITHFVAVSHVPPYDVDFDKNLESGYSHLLASTPGCRLSLHGHLHTTSDSYPYNDGVRYIGSNAVVKNEAILLKLIDGKVIKTMIRY